MVRPVDDAFVAFDLETAKVLPDSADLVQNMPLGITVAACRLPSGEVRTWHGGTADRPAPRMTREESAALVDDLLALSRDGTPLVTWNGAAFDFLALAHESGRWADCARLAREHVDVMFHFFCAQGYPVSLTAVALTLGLKKAAGMTGDEAPAAWKRGEHARVLSYVAGDVALLADIYRAGKRDRGLSWVTKAGQRRRWNAPKLLSVAKALELPEPDVSWMKNPRRRTDLVGWMQKALREQE